jgi:hypothetical protein
MRKTGKSKRSVWKYKKAAGLPSTASTPRRLGVLSKIMSTAQKTVELAFCRIGSSDRAGHMLKANGADARAHPFLV